MSCCSVFGTFSVFVVLIQLVCGVWRWLYANIIGPSIGEPINCKSFGKWALITGATDGIGKEYAKTLAKRGLNIILVSRTLSKLEAVAKEIREAYNVDTAIIDVDFTSGEEIYDKIKDRVKGKEIGILVNNVGVFYTAPDFFLSIPDREKMIRDIVRCNITSMPMMCSIILPQMFERKRGLIINISSLSAAIPAGNMTVYSASKAFAHKFSCDLASEYAKDGIIVQSVLPGAVATNMTHVTTDTWNTPSAKTYVESAFRTIGFASATNGYYPHALLQMIAQLIHFISPSLSRSITLKRMGENRNRIIKKGLYKSATN